MTSPPADAAAPKQPLSGRGDAAMASNYPDDFDHRAFEAAYGSDPVADAIMTARIPHALSKLAYALGFDTIGDAAIEAMDEALADDGIDIDDYDHAVAIMDSETRTATQAAKLLTDDVGAVERLAARAAIIAARVPA